MFLIFYQFMNLFYERRKFAQNYRQLRSSEVYTSLAKRPHQNFSSVSAFFFAYFNFYSKLMKRASISRTSAL